MLEKYSSLPMLLDEAAIAAAVDGILRDAADPSVSRLDVANALGGMLDRQTEHYKPFDAETTAKIEGWIVKSWQPESAPLVDAVATLIASSDMPEGRRLLEEAERSSSDPEVRRIAAETLEEIRGDESAGG
jgi:hypothetical protein